MSFSDFSICLTILNNESTISRCLSSITKFCPEAEIVVVESFSTDRTFAIASSFKNVKCHRKKCDRGEGFQSAASLASGKFLAFMAGDWEVLESIGGLLKAYRRFYGEKGLLLEAKKPRQQVFTPLLLIPKEAFLRVGGFRSLQYGEDQDLYVRLAADGLLLCTDVNPFIYHNREANRSRTTLSFAKVQFDYYHALSLAGFGMSWRMTPLFPIRLLGYLTAYPRRDKANHAAKRIGSMDIRIDLQKRMNALYHCYLPPTDLFSKIEALGVGQDS